jgi:hypothetical protein
MSTNRNSLVGRWVNYSVEDSYKNGQIILSLGTGHHLVRWQAMTANTPPLTELVRNDDFCTDDSKDRWVVFFDTEAEMHQWVNFMNSPSEKKGPKIVPMKPKS